MRILFTGCTGRQTRDEPRIKMDRCNDSTIIVNSLRRSGHTVIRSTVSPGDELAEFDLVIVGIGAFGSMNYSGGVLGSLYALGAHRNVIAFHEDWKIDTTMKSMRHTLEKGLEDRLRRRFEGGKPFYHGTDHPDLDRELIMEVVKVMVAGGFRSLVPAFGWGDKSIISTKLGGAKVEFIDQTSHVLDWYNMHPMNEPKRDGHMFAALGNFDRWIRDQKLTWPVAYFGKSHESAIELPTERDVFNETGRHWGVLCPPYPTAGSGWFRLRYVYAALNGSIIIADPRDLKALGIESANLEELSLEARKEYANHQAERIMAPVWTTTEFDERLNAIVQFGA